MSQPESFTREDYYSVNNDFTGTRNVRNGQELVEYHNRSLHRIWLNEQQEGFAPHWHTAMEIVVPVENYYDYIIQGKLYRVNPGEILFVPPGELHEIPTPPAGRRFIFIMNISPLQKLRGFGRINSILSQPMHINAENNTEIYTELYDILLQIRNEYFNNSEFSELSIHSLLLKLFVVLGENYTQKETAFTNSSPNKRREYIQLFNETLEYIDTHFTEDLSLEEIAANTGFSKFHFSRLFKEYTNSNFSDYLCFRRIKEAEQLLETPGVSITDAATLSGFSSISTFNRLFKQQKGCTPSEYRKQASHYGI